MKLKFALIFSVCALSSGGVSIPGTAFAKVASGEVASSRETLLSQITLQKDRVSVLEAENARLRKAVEALKALAYGAGGQSSEAPGGKKHVIQEGETVSQIASQHGITREKLMQVNGIAENQQLYVGDELVVPAAPEIPQGGEQVVAESSPGKAEQIPPANPAPTPAPAPDLEKSPAPTLEKETTIAWTEPGSEEPQTNPAPAKATPEPTQPVAAPPEAEPSVLAIATPAPKAIPAPKATPAPKAEETAPPVLVSDADGATVREEKPHASIAPKLQAGKSPPTPSPAAPEGGKKDFTYYTIKFGDNLGKIAKNHGISIGALMSFNGIKNPNKISGGQKLKIPSREKAESLSKVRPSSAPSMMVSTNGKPLPGDAYGIYTVQTGDTLYDLARDFFTTEKEIQQLNKMGNKTNIVPGQELIVPMAEYSKKSNLVTSTEGS